MNRPTTESVVLDTSILWPLLGSSFFDCSPVFPRDMNAAWETVDVCGNMWGGRVGAWPLPSSTCSLLWERWKAPWGIRVSGPQHTAAPPSLTNTLIPAYITKSVTPWTWHNQVSHCIWGAGDPLVVSWRDYRSCMEVCTVEKSHFTLTWGVIRSAWV